MAFTFLSIAFVDCLGRRTLTLTSLVGITVSYVVLVLSFTLEGQSICINNQSIICSPIFKNISSTFGLCFFIASFGIGMGPMPWTINAEIYPTIFRSAGNSFSTTTNWLGNTLVSMTFLTMSNSITIQGSFA